MAAASVCVVSAPLGPVAVKRNKNRSLFRLPVQGRQPGRFAGLQPAVERSSGKQGKDAGQDRAGAGIGGEGRGPAQGPDGCAADENRRRKRPADKGSPADPPAAKQIVQYLEWEQQGGCHAARQVAHPLPVQLPTEVFVGTDGRRKHGDGICASLVRISIHCIIRYIKIRSNCQPNRTAAEYLHAANCLLMCQLLDSNLLAQPITGR